MGPLRPDGLKLGRPRGAPGNTGSVGETWKLALIWCLETGHATRPGEIWCGTIPGAFFHSADRSASWSLNRALRHDPTRQEWFGGGYDYPGVHSVSLHPDEPDTMLVGVSARRAETFSGDFFWAVRAPFCAEPYIVPAQVSQITPVPSKLAVVPSLVQHRVGLKSHLRESGRTQESGMTRMGPCDQGRPGRFVCSAEDKRPVCVG